MKVTATCNGFGLLMVNPRLRPDCQGGSPMSQARIPAWISVGVLPAVNILLAFLVSAILFYYLDINPVDAAEIMWYGAFGTGEGVGFTLYYATGFIFTGLSVAVAFHAGLFNIGGEGQAYIGGLGVGLVCLLLGDSLPFALLLPLAIIAGGLFGAAWAFIPAWLQAKRGSHIVITTIMFNFIAASLMAYLLVEVFAGGLHGHREQGVCRGELAAEDERTGGSIRHGNVEQPAQHQLLLGTALRGPGVGLHLAYPLGLRDPLGRRQPECVRLCRYLLSQGGDPGHGDLRHAVGLLRPQRAAG